jgi:hypothetical protein
MRLTTSRLWLGGLVMLACVKVAQAQQLSITVRVTEVGTGAPVTRHRSPSPGC